MRKQKIEKNPVYREELTDEERAELTAKEYFDEEKEW